MLQVDNLTFHYPGAANPAVQGLTFSIADGELFGFLGPSGAGKSTTQKILNGLLREYTGTVAVFGKNLTDWQSDYYERIGVTFEFPNHFLKLTALENLTYFSKLYTRKCESPRTVLEWVDLTEAGEMLVSQFSKGMKTRLSVARALLHRPDFLFLDEPTAGLDPVNAHRIKEIIKSQKSAGKTVFLTTHDMAVADELCDRVAFILDGRIKLIEQPRKLKLQYGKANVRVEYKDGTGTATREFPLAGLGDNAEFLHLLQNSQVQTLHSMEATLEEIFIQITGRGLS